ncbi:alpha/beta fold hydrolase [Paradevosia shaoguanensis]|uniref:Alpha/beta hydrolase n=1 Tax=Paradevosia shaoguanensis TaxID=1335043 RepID=A0AA41QM74_9HYPH|nr:alpha/beta hydrolase [Paradevosia shaoguanensis]MCF1742254.1 alpha/beta hydrolase [Paradevosia shaoguanensis]MCI0126737.1 alpha/beta hydrolase [Paradevosia shaoguanensis]
MANRNYPPDHPPFAALPVRTITIGTGADQMAVHISGRLSSRRVPVICVPGYQRNMTDFTDFIRYFGRLAGESWPVVLVDLFGRGRSTDRSDKLRYASPQDAADLCTLADALGIERAAFVGQGYGGQVTMALAARRPGLIAGSVLIDAGPLSDSRGLVRLRGNLQHIAGWRGEAVLRAGMRQILSRDYPGLTDPQLDALALRTHFIDKRGRAHALFDPHLLKMLDSFEADDVLVAQWPLFDALQHIPLMLFRSQLTDQLRRETFEAMTRRRPEAPALIINDEGSPALLNHPDEVRAIVAFVEKLGKPGKVAA